MILFISFIFFFSFSIFFFFFLFLSFVVCLWSFSPWACVQLFVCFLFAYSFSFMTLALLRLNVHFRLLTNALFIPPPLSQFPRFFSCGGLSITYKRSKFPCGIFPFFLGFVFLFLLLLFLLLFFFRFLFQLLLIN